MSGTLNGEPNTKARYFCGYDVNGKHICYWDKNGFKKDEGHIDCTDMSDAEFIDYLYAEKQIDISP